MRERQVMKIVLMVVFCACYFIFYQQFVQKIDIKIFPGPTREDVLATFVENTYLRDSKETNSPKKDSLPVAKIAAVKKADSSDASKYGSSKISLNDVIITVKTTKTSHAARLGILLKTWIKKAKKQTYVITDSDDELVQTKIGDHLVPTECGASHQKFDLCCKMGMEFDVFMRHNRKWWCHMDDDMYVNVERLVGLLNEYDWRKEAYVGRRSAKRLFKAHREWANMTYIFAHGGAGFCISKTLADKMKPWCGNGKMEETCRRAQLADDCAIGFVVNNLLNVSLQQSMLFHSHVEKFSKIDTKELKKQVTFSYKNNSATPFGEYYQPAFHTREDPSRFYSIHCLIYPNDSICPTWYKDNEEMRLQSNGGDETRTDDAAAKIIP